MWRNVPAGLRPLLFSLPCSFLFPPSVSSLKSLGIRSTPEVVPTVVSKMNSSELYSASLVRSFELKSSLVQYIASRKT